MRLGMDDDAVLYGPSDADLGDASANADYGYIPEESADVSSHASPRENQVEIGVQTGQGGEVLGGMATAPSEAASKVGYGRRVEPRHAHFQKAALREYTRRAKPLIESVKTFIR